MPVLCLVLVANAVFIQV